MELKSVDLYKPRSIFAESREELEDNLSAATNFEHFRVAGEELQLTDGGTMVVRGEEKQLTEEAIKNLCKELHIPDPFAKRIPLHTLQYNIQQLSQGRQFEVFTSNTNNHWVNFIDRDKLLPIEIPTILEAITEQDTFGFKRAEINEAGVALFYQAPDMIKPVRVNDLVSFGWQLRLSESGFGIPSGSIYALRLVCTNGAIAPRRYGSFRFPKRGEIETRTQVFLQDIVNSHSRLEKFVDAYKQVASGEGGSLPGNRDFNRIWNAVKKTLGDPETADIVLGIDKDTRTTIKSKVRDERDLFSDDEDDTPVVPTTWYDLMNKVTEAPQTLKLTGRAHQKMQALGGKMIDFAIRQNQS